MFTSAQVKSAILSVDGRATAGGVVELPPGARLLLDVIVPGGAGTGTTPTDAEVASLVNTTTSGTRGALSATYVPRAEAVLKATNYGFSPSKTAADNTTAINAATAAAASLRDSLGVRSVVIEVQRGKYNVNKFAVPGGVSLYGEDRDSTALVNGATDGGVFVHFKGSGSRLRGITIDGKRAVQVTAGSGLAAVQFSRPNNPTAGGTNIAGGVVLTAAPTAGATSLSVDTASPGGEPIRAGEVITLVEGALYEMVRIARTYTGGLTIPLESATANAFTVAAKVSVAVCDVDATECLVYSNGRDGIAFWHVIGGYADDNIIRDFEDTGIDLPSAGSRFVHIRRNQIETKGRWGIAFDTAETEFGRVTDCTSQGNTIRFLPGGGGFLSGGATDGIYLGVSDRIQSIDDTVDLTLAGISGFRLAGSGANFSNETRIVNPTVRGPVTPRAGTFGIRSTMGPLNAVLHVIGGNISGVAKCIEPDAIRTTLVEGTRMWGFADYGVNFLADGTAAQLATVTDCVIDGGVAAIRFGGTTAAAGNAVRTSGNILRGQSFAPIVVDAGWNHVTTVNGALSHDGSKVGFYGVAPAVRPTALTATAAAAPAGGVGAAAGGWDTAANRDASIATINNLKTRVDELETKLRALGLLT